MSLIQPPGTGEVALPALAEVDEDNSSDVKENSPLDEDDEEEPSRTDNQDNDASNNNNGNSQSSQPGNDKPSPI